MEKSDTTDISDHCRDQTVIESVFERALWNSRYIVLLGVVFGALSAIVLFFAGSLDMLAMAVSICVICVGVYFLGRHHV